MRVGDGVRKTVVFVGHDTPHGFVPYGTGFVTASAVDGLLFQTLVTARHVIERIPGDDVFLRINRRAGDAQILIAEKSEWLCHPDKRVDVAVASGILNTESFDILHLSLEGPSVLTEAQVAEYDVGIGDEVFVAGMFTARLGDVKNIPILRTGNIAAMPEEEVQTEYGFHHAYLIEARSIDGLSGSPVHVHRSPIRADQDGQMKFQQGQMQLLLGMLLGHNPVTNPSDTIRISPSANPSEEDAGANVRVPWNTGIGVVIPISYVVEAVNQPAMLEWRRRAMRDGVAAADRTFRPSPG